MSAYNSRGDALMCVIVWLFVMVATVGWMMLLTQVFSDDPFGDDFPGSGRRVVVVEDRPSSDCRLDLSC